MIDSESEATHYLIEDWRYYDQALSEIGTRPSEFEIDRLLARFSNARARKALDASLNAGFHRYDWTNALEGRIDHGLRRFRSVEREPAAGERASAEALLAEVHHGKAIDTLVIARRTQALIERLTEQAAAPAPPPPAPTRDPLDVRELLGVQARLEPLRTALERVDDGDPLDVRRAVPGSARRASPRRSGAAGSISR